MSQSHALRSSNLAYLDQSAPLPLLAIVAVKVAVTAAKWDTRRRTRRALSKLDLHLRRDIGVEEWQANREAGKPFWKP